jgi:hypothetical protein
VPLAGLRTLGEQVSDDVGQPPPSSDDVLAALQQRAGRPAVARGSGAG